MSKYRMRAAALLAAGAVAGGATAATLSAQAADDAGAASTASADRDGRGGPDRDGRGGPDRDGRGGPGGHGRGGLLRDTTALAEELGVSEDRLSSALEAVRDELAPSGDDSPADGGRRTPPTDEERDEREAALATALAAELGLDEDEVADALETVRSAARAERRTELGERLDQAVEDGELTGADKASVLKAYDAGVLRWH